MSRGEVQVTMPLRHHDIDALGHVNHAVYHELLEEVRYQLLSPLVSKDSFFVLVRVELDYRAEIRHTEGHVVLTGSIEKVGTKSVTVRQEIQKPSGEVAATGLATLVAFDMNARRAREITERERAELIGAMAS